MNKINTGELAALLVGKMNETVTQEQAESFIVAMGAEMTSALKDERRIEFRGFGSFDIRKGKLRTVRNPKTGESIAKVVRDRPHFKPSKMTTLISE
ncbi:HU family DNA-binding protein [Shewanella glacialipiscicola]|uniref:HU family DNA-binding protein n=1 Tax=Shewanella glacialipiscicola TaxID=614069 RepID=UPI003D7B6D51